MKSGSATTKIIVLALLAAVCAFFAVQVYRYFHNTGSTVPTYRYTAEDTIALSGFFVRDETVVTCSDPLVELTCTEGERVALGSRIATVFRSQEDLERTQQAEVLREQLEQLQYALDAAGDTETALVLDGEIAKEITSVRSAVNNGSYSAVTELGSELKTTLLRREFAYGGSDELEARIAALKAEIRNLGGADTARVITAPFAGTYSAVVDGYESVLTPETLQTLTPSALSELTPQDVSDAVGKLIRGNAWYFVAVVSEQDAARLTVGNTAVLRAASGVDFDLPVSIYSVGAAENGRCVIVLKSSRYLAYVTLLRDAGAELVLNTYDGLRIPKNGLRINEDGETGVYCQVGLTAYFKPVDVLYQGEDYFIVRPGEIHSTVLSNIELYTLRANDAVIISAGELYNGKVVE